MMFRMSAARRIRLRRDVYSAVKITLALMWGSVVLLALLFWLWTSSPFLQALVPIYRP